MARAAAKCTKERSEAKQAWIYVDMAAMASRRLATYILLLIEEYPGDDGGLLCQLKFYVYWLLGLGRRASLHQQQALKKGVPEVSRSSLDQNKRKTWAERPTLPLDRCRKAHDLRWKSEPGIVAPVGPPFGIATLASDNYGNDDPYNILKHLITSHNYIVI